MEDPMDGGLARDMADMANRAKGIAGMAAGMMGGPRPDAFFAALDALGITKEVREIVDSSVMGLVGGQLVGFGIKPEEVDPVIEIAGQQGPDDGYWFVPDEDAWTKVMALAMMQERIGQLAAEGVLRFFRNTVCEYHIALQAIHDMAEGEARAKVGLPMPSEDLSDEEQEAFDASRAKLDEKWRDIAISGVQFMVKAVMTMCQQAMRG